MYKLEKDFLDKDIADNIEVKLLGWTFPWYYQNHVAQKGDNEFALFHVFWNQEEFGNRPVSNFFDIIKPLIEKINPKKLLRVKANCYTNQNKEIIHNYHTDQKEEHKVALYYVNTNNGHTEIKDHEKILSIKNSCLLFDGYHEHRSTTQTDTNLRVNININYL